MKKNCFFIEGIGGSGKTTLLYRLKEKYEAEHRLNDIFVPELSNSLLGSFLQNGITAGFKISIPGANEGGVDLLVLLDRISQLRVHEDLLRVADIIFFDEFFLSIMAHAFVNLKCSTDEAVNRGIYSGFKSLEEFMVRDVALTKEPHYIYLDCAVETARQRIEHREGRSLNSYEINRLNSIHREYQNLISRETRIHLINANEGIDRVLNDVLNIVENSNI